MAPDLERARAIFLHAVGRLPADQWDAYVADACQGDSVVEARARHLLGAHAEAGSFLERPAVGPVDPDTPPTTFPDTTAPAAGPGAGAVIAGRYKLLEKIGEGGMGEVWVADQADPLRRKVALKLIKVGMDTKTVLARFEVERQALALMDHPNIAKVHDGGVTEAGRPFVVMELVRGTPITRYCDEHKLTPVDRLGLFVDVCAAVQHAHQKGVIHRDLKPSNVLVGLYDGRPVVKVIDFGVAKAVGQPLTERTLHTGFGTVVGTPEYMSPEQATLDNLDVDTRSDVYSLGVVLYELLTGTTPVTRRRVREAALLEVLRVVREEDPPRPSTRLGTTEELPSIAASRGLEPRKLSGLVRGELDWIVMKALEKDRGRRYESATALGEDLRRYLAGEPVQAVPASAAYRVRKFVRKHRGPVAGAAAVLLVLVGGVIGTTWGLLRAERAREAEAARAGAEARERQQAQQNLDLAYQVLDDLYVDVPNRRLDEQAPVSAEDRDRLGRALGFYEVLAGQEPNGPDGRRKAGQAYRRVGEIQHRLGQYEPAAAAARRGVELLEAAAADPAATGDLRVELGRCQNNLGLSLMALGRWEPAETAVRRAIDLYQGWVDEHPADARGRAFLGRGQSNLAVVLTQTGRHREAGEAGRRALDVFAGLAGDDPRFEHLRALAAVNLTNIQMRQGDAAGAEAYARQAIAVYAGLAGADPTDPGPLEGWAKANLNLGGLLARTNRPAEAEGPFRQGLDLATRLRARFPNAAEHWDVQAAAQFSLAGWFRSTSRPKEAEEAYRQAVQTRVEMDAQFPRTPARSESLAECYLNLGHLLRETRRTDEAVAEYRAGLRRVPDSHKLQGSLARVLATSDAGEPALQEAVELASRAARAVPADANYWNTLGLACCRTGDWAVAVEALEKSVELGRGDLWDWLALAVAHARLGHPDEARRYFNRAGAPPPGAPVHPVLKRLRAEAAELLGIAEDPKPKTN